MIPDARMSSALPRKTLTAGWLLILSLLAGACMPLASKTVQREASQIRVESNPNDLSPTQGSSEPATCQTTFEKRELREPYQRYDADQPRYTLSEGELGDYLDLMGIGAICLPTQFGAPFLNVDWDEAQQPASGRLLSIGFEDLYQGGGWSSAYLLFSTYDFSIGTEYETFATAEDYDLVASGALTDTLTAGGGEGFIRYHAGIPMGLQVIMKTYVFPFKDYYVAGVINLGVYDPQDSEMILAEMAAGNHPDLVADQVLLMDALISSIEFQP